MTMRVTYNEESNFALKHMNHNVLMANKSIAKLSSGQKINSAADNPSMFAISQRMRERIRSLDQDELNVQNGSSMLTTAERGVHQIVEVLQHMKTLAVNAANDSNTDEDRQTLQREMESYRSTINDIVYNTRFNNKILLDGRYEKTTSILPATAEHLVDSFSAGSDIVDDFDAATNAREVSNPGTKTITNFGTFDIAKSFTGSKFSVKLDFSAMTAQSSSYPDALHGKGFSILCSGCNQFINIVFDATKNVYQSTYNKNASSINSSAREFVIGVKNVNGKDDLASTIYEGISFLREETDYNNIESAFKNSTDDSFIIDKHNLGMARKGNDFYFTKEANLQMMFTNEIIPTDTEPLTVKERIGGPLWIQDGTLAGQRIHTYINSMQSSDLKGEIFNTADIAKLNSISDSTERKAFRELLNQADGKSIDDISLATREDAKVAMRVIDGALDYALDEQTSLGAYIKRMNYVDENIMTKSENIQAADSGIRDTDIASEMSQFAKYNLLTQSAQFMLAQANQLPGSVLRLLQPENSVA